jgi:hypothetical protein
MSLESLVHTLSAEQRDALQALLVQAQTVPTPEPTPSPTSYYNLDDAVDVTFKADLSVNDKSRDTSYATRFDHVWCKGQYRVKGPKGGVYFVGRCVMGVKKGQQVKGLLRVGNRYFEAFLEGQPLDAWFRPDGADDAVLIGTLTNYRAV